MSEESVMLPHATLRAGIKRILRGPSAEGSGEPPPGAALAVRIGERIFAEVGGHRVLAADEPAGVAKPMTLTTQHDLASVTKILGTTLGLMRLVSTTTMGLDDTLRKYFPRITGDKSDLTIRDLLFHRGGFWEWWPLYMTARSATEALETISALPLRYRPGFERHYSDLGFMVLGMIVEIVTGLPLDRAMRTLVFDPLQLTQTGYAHPQTATGEVAASSFGDRFERQMVESGSPYPVPFGQDEFSGWRGYPLLGEVNDGNAFHVFHGVAGHAGLFSTVEDVLTAATALAESSRYEQLWSRETIQSFFEEGPDPMQSLGFRRYRVGASSSLLLLGHPGFTGSVFGFSPDGNLAFVLATNRLHSRGEPVDTKWLLGDALATVEALIEEKDPGDLR